MTRVWIWYADSMVFKAVFNPLDNSIMVYDENDGLLFSRKGVSEDQIKKIEQTLSALHAKRLDRNQKPFVYL